MKIFECYADYGSLEQGSKIKVLKRVKTEEQAKDWLWKKQSKATPDKNGNYTLYDYEKVTVS